MNIFTFFSKARMAGISLALMLFCVASISSASLFKRVEYFPIENLPKQSNVPGGVALVPFNYRASKTPEVNFRGNRVMVVNTGKYQWHAVVGLPLKLKPGKHEIEVKRKKETEAIDFEVADKEYEAQYITGVKKAHVSPSAESLKRIGKESKIMKSIFASWNEQKLDKITMNYPVEGPLSSQFGLKRFFNNQPRNPHSGLDIAAPRGSVINNPLPGKVAAIGDYYFNGNTVLVDHGQGLISMYCHMDSITVEEGQQIEEGVPIGTVGSTGRATGPHLHWSLNLNNVRVDPMLFLTGQEDGIEQEQ